MLSTEEDSPDCSRLRRRVGRDQRRGSGRHAAEGFLADCGGEPGRGCLAADGGASGGGWEETTYRQLRDQVARCGGGVAGCWSAAGPADGADDAQPARVPCRRPGGDVPAGDAGLDLQLVVAGGAAVPRRSRRGGDRGRRGRRVPRAVLEGARRAPSAAPHLRHRPAAR